MSAALIVTTTTSRRRSVEAAQDRDGVAPDADDEHDLPAEPERQVLAEQRAGYRRRYPGRPPTPRRRRRRPATCPSVTAGGSPAGWDTWPVERRGHWRRRPGRQGAGARPAGSGPCSRRRRGGARSAASASAEGPRRSRIALVEALVDEAPNRRQVALDDGLEGRRRRVHARPSRPAHVAVTPTTASSTPNTIVSSTCRGARGRSPNVARERHLTVPRPERMEVCAHGPMTHRPSLGDSAYPERHPPRPRPTMPGMPRGSGQPAIAVVGSLNIDLIAYMPRVPDAGETLIGDEFQMGFGGKGANQAVMAARLGARVSMVGALGDDVYADMTLDNLARQGVDASHVARVAGSSGVAPIWVEPDGTNRIIVVPGANDLVDPDAAAEAIRSMAGVRAVDRPARDPAAGHGRGLPRRTAMWAPRRSSTPRRLRRWTPSCSRRRTGSSPTSTSSRSSPAPSGRSRGRSRRLTAAAARLGPRLVVTLGSKGAAVVARRAGRAAARGRGRARSTRRAPATPSSARSPTDWRPGSTSATAVRLGIACASDSVTRQGTQSSYASPEQAREIVERVLAG